MEITNIEKKLDPRKTKKFTVWGILWIAMLCAENWVWQYITNWELVGKILFAACAALLALLLRGWVMENNSTTYEENANA